MIIFRIFLITLFLILNLNSASAAPAKVVTTKVRANFILVTRESEIIDLVGNAVIEREDLNVLADKMRVYYTENKPTKDALEEQKRKEKEKEIRAKEKELIKNNYDEAAELIDKEIKKEEVKKDPKPKESSAIKKIEALNNVKVFDAEFVATGNYGYYNPKENNFILEKNVIFNNGTSVAHGERFVYDFKTKKGSLVGDKILKKDSGDKDGRVTVIIDERDMPKKKNK